VITSRETYGEKTRITERVLKSFPCMTLTHENNRTTYVTPRFRTDCRLTGCILRAVACGIYFHRRYHKSTPRDRHTARILIACCLLFTYVDFCTGGNYTFARKREKRV